MDENGGELLLDDALFARAVAVIDAVVRRRCRNWKLAADVPHEVRSEVLLRLMRRLRDRESDPIARFEDYVAGITSRVIDDMVRSALPEWARLKHRVRYVLDHDDRFALTVYADGRTGCAAPAKPFGQRRVQTRAADELAQMMLEFLRDDERPIDDLVNQIAGRLGIIDPVHVEPASVSVSAALDPGVGLESLQSLNELWREIRALPPRQRLALLLNARDAAGDSVMRLLIESGVVTARELALAVDVRESDLEPLIARLPMMDVAIAEWLQVTRQQVINLRSAARDRLARRTSRKR
jgi:hypothetical protein